MRDILDLSDYHSVVQHRRALELVFGLPVEDPNYMPVTRDLSPARRAMLLKWLAEPDPPLLEIADPASLKSALQLAIELEHSTIPPYLCALFSIVEGRNREVAAIIRSVVIEEMLHMALACNLLNAVGGEPQIDKAGFVPSYPGHLPAGLRPDLTVTLRRCSIDQIRDVFLSIEEPEEVLVESGVDALPTIDTRDVTVDQAGLLAAGARDAAGALERWFTSVQHPKFTIGWFYNQIARAIITLSDSGTDLFVGDPSRQLTPEDWPNAPSRLYRIDGKESALLAIHEIVRQGEGTSLTDPLDEREELAHYFRFKEIVEGRQMVKNADGKWVFEGPPIRFDPDGVYPMVDDPDTATLPADSQVKASSRQFNATYSDLLRSLHGTFNGNPAGLRAAIGLMYTTEVQATELMRTPISAGAPTTAGPAFQAG
jgi:rubrerythrin